MVTTLSAENCKTKKKGLIRARINVFSLKKYQSLIFRDKMKAYIF